MMTTFDHSTPTLATTNVSSTTTTPVGVGVGFSMNHHHHHLGPSINDHHFGAAEALTAAAVARNGTSSIGSSSTSSSSNPSISSNSPSSNLSNDNDSTSNNNTSHSSISSSLSSTSTTTPNNNNNNQQQQQIQFQPDPIHLQRIFQECRTRLAVKQKNLEQLSNRLQSQHSKAQQDVQQGYQMALNSLEKGKNDLLKELEDVYNARLISLTIFTSKIEEHLRKIEQMLYYMEQQQNGQDGQQANDSLMNCKSFLDNKLQAILNIDLDSSYHSNDIEFVLNYQTIQTIIKSNIGYIRTNSNNNSQSSSSSSSMIDNNTNNNNNNNNGHQQHNHHNGVAVVGSGKYLSSSSSRSSNSSSTFGHQMHHHQHHSSMNGFESPNGTCAPATLVDRFGSFSLNNCHQNRSLSSSISDSLNGFTYDKWSAVGGGVGSMNGNCLSGGSNSSPDSTLFSAWANAVPDSCIADLASATTDSIDLMNNGTGCEPNLSVTPVLPIKSQVQRQKMIYHCKFGEFGIMEGQFTEPSGVAVNAQNDIIVADTNNHRIQIFDKDGRFKFQFGECGKRDGQLLYPNRVAVVKQSGDIIVTERSPTHQIQVYNQYGQFVRKFGADILQHPRGVTVDNKGNIIIVECKVMRVIIFDLMGNVLHKFGCSKHLEFPNGVVVNDKQEIFISDNRAHCVKVFSYSGTFLRNIGGEGLTNYPIGVCINDNGEILVADNHNNFNITIFTQDGQLVNALESKVKHSQCFDVALMDDNSVVLASKDYRIYIYRYLQLQSLATAVATSGIC